MMGGGILDERNDRGLDTLPESEVNFLTKLVALKPGKTVREMIKNVMLGKDEGAESPDSNEKSAAGQKKSGGIFGRTSVSGVKPLPVRPGMFLETVTKVEYIQEISLGLQHSILNGLLVTEVIDHSLVSGSSEHTSNSSRNCILGPFTIAQEHLFLAHFWNMACQIVKS
nr:protein PEP-RELATED DEVELOPMENT ARRESTED 1, chloroplastic [Ipomoea batatas]